jgi:hypothetical protein
VEKEGFHELLKAARIAERYDVAIFSTKGMTVTAARLLAERLAEKGVTILVLHDFDKSGFSILHTLRADTRRYKYRTRPLVEDLGLRLEDVICLNLQREPVFYDTRKDPRENLLQSGATQEEAAFLVHGRDYDGWSGERVELNALTSQQFIDFLEAGLQRHGVQKVVPDEAVLAQAYRRARRLGSVRRAAEAAWHEAADEEVGVPADLAEAVRKRIEGTPIPWDEALWQIVSQSWGS